MLNKLKSLLLDDTVYMAFLLVLVALASFGLGRLSVQLPQNQPAAVAQSVVNLVKTPELLPVSSTTTAGPVPSIETLAPADNATKNFVASKSGTRYHKLTCGGAKQIKESNKVFFGTEDEAQAAGYTRAANCKF